VQKDHVFIVGDMNIDVINNTVYGQDFEALCRAYSFVPLIKVPTHVTQFSSSCLDHIWYNKLNYIESGAFDVDITDHYPIFACLPIVSVQKSYMTKYFRDHGPAAISDLRSKIAASVDFRGGVVRYEGANIDDAVSGFLEKLYEIYNRSCPIRSKQVSLNSYLKPWITKELKICIRRKHMLYRQFKLGQVSTEYYKTFRNHVTGLTRSLKIKYFRNKFRTKVGDPAAMWRNINSLMSSIYCGLFQHLLRGRW